MCLLIILLKRSPQYVKSCRKKGVLQTIPKLNCCIVALGLITSSQYRDELSDLVPRSTLKSCMLDPIPATVLKNCYDLLLPFITKVVKCSLQNSTLTSDMKRAIVRPSLKKPSLDYQESQTDFQPDISLQALREGSREPIHFPSARK